MTYLIAIIGGYLLGSIPFGLVLTKLAGTEDIRTIGSGNIGATNVLRTGRKDLALATVILDSGKGAFAVLITSYFLSFEAAMLAGFFALIGHCYPVWLKFKGGKGVATTLGTLLALKFSFLPIRCAYADCFIIRALLGEPFDDSYPFLCARDVRDARISLQHLEQR